MVLFGCVCEVFTSLCKMILYYFFQALTGESSISAVTLGCLKNPKTVAGEGTVKSQRWYLKGGVGQDIAAEVMKLLRDMTKVKREKSHWL